MLTVIKRRDYLTPELVQDLCTAYNNAITNNSFPPLILAAAFMLDFVSIHPFRDGNGLMSRLLMLLELHQLGFEVGKYISLERLIEKTKAEYSGIQAPATPETTSVTFGTQEGTLMTREQYKAQQANLPQTGNDKSDKTVAVAGLGILAATTFTTMFGVAKKRHN